MIRLFELDNRIIKPTEHCYSITWLKAIMDEYPDDYITIYAYIFYMSCPSEENPYFNRPIKEREELILRDLKHDIDTESESIIYAVEKATELYETPTVRAYIGIVTLLDNMTDYIKETEITTGKDGNFTSLIRIAEKFDSIRQSYKGVAKDLQEEQEQRARGNENLGYDQM